MPPELFHSDEKTCLARELLAKYGDKKKVRNAFDANYSSIGWTGSSSKVHEKRKKDLLEFKKKEKNPNVIAWIDEHIEDLDHLIVEEKIREERMGLL